MGRKNPGHPRTDTRHGVIYVVVGILLGVGAVFPVVTSGRVEGGPEPKLHNLLLLLLWPGVNYLFLGGCYLRNGDVGTWVLGKSESTGRLHPLSVLVFLPYLLVSFVLWRAKHLLLGEPVCERVWEGIYVGRWPWELNIEDSRFASNPITHIVDLTGEFPSLSFHRKRGVTYICCPSMDRLLASPALLAAAVRTVSRDARCTYVHCANGHGRSGLFAAMMLVYDGHCKTIDEALLVMKQKRQVLNWQPHQQRVAEQALELLRNVNSGLMSGSIELKTDV
jgi:protein-tyrosine phosphatase